MLNTADAQATSRGMLSGEGADLLINTGTLDTGAISNVTLEAVSASLNYGADFSAGIVSFDTSADSRSTALGMDARAETLATDNRSMLITTATANASNLGIVTSVDYVETGASLNGSMMQTDVESSAVARGIQSQSSATIANSGRIETTANAFADSISVDAAIALAKDAGVVGGVSIQSSTLQATSNAAGLWGTNVNLFFLNTGDLATVSNARTDASLVDVDVQATTTGLAFDIGALDAETVATAIGTGLRGRGELARVDNIGSISVVADADSDATSVTAGLNVVPSVGFTLSGALTNAETTAKSSGYGMQLITDSAEILNAGFVEVRSSAKSNADAVNVSAGFVGTGLIFNASAIEASSLAKADAHGIFARNLNGEAIGNDTIRLGAGLNTRAEANADSDAITVNLDLVKAGVNLGAAVIDAGSTAQSLVRGVHSGDGFDLIEFTPLAADDPMFAGDVFNVDAISNVNSTAFGLEIDIALGGGVATSNAIIEAASIADADAFGFDAGNGNDNVIINGASIIGAEAKIRGAAIGVTLSGSGGGVAGGAALTNLTQSADARAEGVRGGLGADNLINNSTITTQAIADARGVGVSIGGSFAVGAAGGVAIADVTTKSASKAIGMGGNSFSTGGDAFSNILTNTGLLTTNAVSVGASDAISIRGDIALLPISVALADASSSADARATGMAGATGNDQFFNTGLIETYSRATSRGVSASVGLAGGIYWILVMEEGVDCGVPCDTFCVATCEDGIQNGDETGIDCGGSNCILPCAPPTCFDGIQNGLETGVDCGAPGCPDCPMPTCDDGIQNVHIEYVEISCEFPLGYIVVVETGPDCDNDFTTSCPDCPIPTCFDGVQNGNETGIDCDDIPDNFCPPCDPVPSCGNGYIDGTETGVDCDDDPATICPPCATCSDGIQNGPEIEIDCVDYPIGAYDGGSCPQCVSCHNGDLDEENFELQIDCGGPNCETCPEFLVADIDGSPFQDQASSNAFFTNPCITTVPDTIFVPNSLVLGPTQGAFTGNPYRVLTGIQQVPTQNGTYENPDSHFPLHMDVIVRDSFASSDFAAHRRTNHGGR